MSHIRAITLPVESAQAIERIFLTQPAGARIVYHVGNLAIDRDPAHSALKPEAAETLAAVADFAMLLEQEGRADLLRRRVCEGIHEYILVKRATPGRAVDWEVFADRPPIAHGMTEAAKHALARAKYTDCEGEGV